MVGFRDGPFIIALMFQLRHRRGLAKQEKLISATSGRRRMEMPDIVFRYAIDRSRNADWRWNDKMKDAVYLSG
jgi:hypothetical protein